MTIAPIPITWRHSLDFNVVAWSARSYGYRVSALIQPFDAPPITVFQDSDKVIGTYHPAELCSKAESISSRVSVTYRLHKILPNRCVWLQLSDTMSLSQINTLVCKALQGATPSQRLESIELTSTFKNPSFGPIVGNLVTTAEAVLSLKPLHDPKQAFTLSNLMMEFENEKLE